MVSVPPLAEIHRDGISPEKPEFGLMEQVESDCCESHSWVETVDGEARKQALAR